MESRICTSFFVFVGYCRQTRWILNRQFIKHLPLRVLTSIRSGEISERRLLRIVNIALNTGLRLRKETYSLEDIFFEIYRQVANSDEFEDRREYRFSIESIL
ncbi:MAG: aminoacyltransferase [Bacteroidales bacterium]|nr:aminoacyltransferase [Bacteroidales bacterium]